MKGVRGNEPNVGGFEAWFEAVALPVLSAANRSSEEVLTAFIAASEGDVAGHVRPGGYELLRAIAKLKYDGEVQPIDGVW